MDSEPGYLRIATEEAFAPPELVTLWRAMLADGTCDSHTQGEYLDDPKFWPIFEAAEAVDTPIYLHPNTPPRNMVGPMLEAGLDGAIYGFTVETGLHLLRIITAGVFDRFPRLRIVVGHLGEALPFWLYRLDYMHAATVKAGRHEAIRPIGRRPSEYLRPRRRAAARSRR
jgi:5-carboxyvanillate decarboxylase